MAVVIQTVDDVVVNRFTIEPPGLRFGRTTQNQIQIDDTAVSNNHAEIIVEQRDDGEVIYMLRDMGSTNGTFVNERMILDSLQLFHGDIIRVGWNTFTFVDEQQQTLEKTDRIKKSWIPGVYYTEDKD